MEQKIKQDEIFIGQNIRRIRKEKGMRQTELVALIQLENVPLTREALVKIERGIQHIQASQLRASFGKIVSKTMSGENWSNM